MGHFNFGDGALRQLAASADMRTVAAGERVIQEGDQISVHFFVVFSGSFDVLRAYDANSMELPSAGEDEVRAARVEFTFSTLHTRQTPTTMLRAP